MDNKSYRINLTQKRKAENGLWQFYPVRWEGNKPDPRLIIIDGEPAPWERGAYFLNWREGGKRIRKHFGEWFDCLPFPQGAITGSHGDQCATRPSSVKA